MEKLLGIIPIKFEYVQTLVISALPAIGTLLWTIITV